MKKSLFIIFAISLICIIGGFIFASQEILAQSTSEKIKDFQSDITVEQNSNLLFKESILYDFGSLQKHGIYRIIPLGENSKITVKKVEDELGNKYQIETSKESGNLKIRIGDPDKTITGVHTYNIFYEVSSGLRFFQDHDELYWNITGNNWEVPIEQSSVVIHLPQKIFENDLSRLDRGLSTASEQFDCFTGAYGSKEKNCSWEIKENGDIYFKSQISFNPGEGLTIALGWPKGVVLEPKPLPKWLWLLKNFWPVFIPISVFIYLLRKWWKIGRDPHLKKTIIAQYEPPDNLLPAEVSALIHQNVNTQDISATIVDLAVKGYLKIKEIKKGHIFKSTDYQLTKLKDFEGLEEYEKDILLKIFEEKNEILISELKGTLQSSFYSIKKVIFTKLTSAKYFISNPQKVMTKYMIIGFMLIGISVLASFFVSVFKMSIAVGSFILASGIIFLIFSKIMPKKTLKGAEARWYALGFKEYIDTAEKYRLEFQEKENLFEKYLPYAISFDLVKKWAKAFEGIYITPPTWYEGNFGAGFSAIVFANSLDHSLSQMNAIVTPAGGGSGLGGGGFSGGGGGGGGGGSW